MAGDRDVTAANSIDAWLVDLLAAIRPITDGKPATYISELAKADPALCGIAIATVDGAIQLEIKAAVKQSSRSGAISTQER